MPGRLSLCAAACLLWAASASAQTFNQEIYYQISPRHSNKCLDLPFSSIDNAVGLQQWDCSVATQANQLWTVVPTGAGTFRIASAQSAKCVDIAGYSTANGAAAQQYDCVVPDIQTNQTFTITPAPTAGYYRIASSHAGKCLDVANLSTANGAAVQQYDCGPAWNANQDWRFVEFSPRVPLTHLRMSGYYISAIDPVPLVNQPFPTKSYANMMQLDSLGLATHLPQVMANGMKVKLALGGALFRLGTRAGGLGQACSSTPGNVFSTATNQGGLINDPGNTYLTLWTAIKDAINNVPGGANGIAAFYIFDEPHAILSAPNYTNFCPSEIDHMLTLVANAVKADFPNTPVMVSDAPYVIDRNWPASIDWIGLSSCYDSPCFGQPPAYYYTQLRARLLPHQRMVTVPPVRYERQWCAEYDPLGACIRFHRPLKDSGAPLVISAAEGVTTLAEQNQLSGLIDFYIDLMLRDTRFVGMAGWLASSHPWPTIVPDQGVTIGIVDIPRARDKMRFRMRALGFGTP